MNRLGVSYPKNCIRCSQLFSASCAIQRTCQACRKCLRCSKDLAYETRKFCSQKCRARWQYDNCPKTRETLAKNLVRGRAGDHTERNKAISKAHLGKPKPRKPIASGTPYAEERRTIAGRLEYRIWRQTVFKRDGWKCVICESRTKLQAHHIRRWKDYPDLRFEVSNGISLCFVCHCNVDEIAMISKFEAWTSSNSQIELSEQEVESLKPIICNCPTCGTLVRRPRSRAKQYKTFYCSRVCQWNSMIKHGNYSRRPEMRMRAMDRSTASEDLGRRRD